MAVKLVIELTKDEVMQQLAALGISKTKEGKVDPLARVSVNLLTNEGMLTGAVIEIEEPTQPKTIEGVVAANEH